MADFAGPAQLADTCPQLPGGEQKASCCSVRGRLPYFRPKPPVHKVESVAKAMAFPLSAALATSRTSECDVVFF